VRTEIQLSPVAVRQIEESLSAGKGLEIRVIGGHLVIFETTSKKKYDVMVAPR